MEISKERARFSWLPFFEEMLNIICERYDKKSLCAVFHDIFGKGGGTTDQFPDGTSGPLEEIDPLTFIAFFNRNNTLKKRVAFCQNAKRKFEMSANVPSDFEGIPILRPENTWFFPYSKNRSPDDIANLWSFSRKLNKGELGAELFEKVLKIKNVGTPKLTVLMFICKPADFISLDGTNVAYFKHNGLEVSVRNFLEYEVVLSRIKEHFAHTTFYEISHYAYLHRSDKPKPGKKDTGNVKYWIIAPGENARLWDNFKNNNIIAIGWDKLGNLENYSNKEAIRQAIQEYYGSETSKTNAALACYQFCRELNIGDHVFVKKGTSEIIGYGKVTSGYVYDNARTEYHHIRDVEWLYIGHWDIPKDSGIPLKTLTEVTDYQDILDAMLSRIKKVTPPIIPKEQYTINDFINETGFSRQNIESWKQQLIRKKQVIFYGPPGTGKTYVAEKLARLMISESSGFYDSVQFHPAYAYEDFIQGFRPKTENGMLTYKIEPGTFLLFCKEAISQAPSPCILIIDEINRAKLSSVFGELMYCLEYREQEVKLAANGALFHIPYNVYLIGTMNTADRSIALVDHALRRRFCFLRLNPEYEILQAYLEKHNYPAEALVYVLKDVNKIIDNPNYEIGISYFMNNSKDLKSVLPLIWKGEIEPYLEELFYDQLKKVADFRWDRLAEDKLSNWVT